MSILYNTLRMTLLSTIFWTILNFGIAFAIRLLPSKCFDEHLKLYQEYGFERKFYRLIKVSKWKHKLPDAGKLIGFNRRKLPKDLNIAYTDRFIKECCIAELGHLLIGTFGYLSIFFAFLLPPDSFIMDILIFTIIATVDFIIQMLFVIIQRYNRPRLIAIRNAQLKK